MVDTSAWIEFFRRRNPHFAVVSQLIAEDTVVTLPLIVAELLQGARSAGEMRQLREGLEVFPALEEHKGAWMQAGALAFQLRKRGIHPGLADCFITVMCIEHSVPIYSLDQHFHQIRRAKTGLRLYLGAAD